ncbi:hypothetical protein BU23DRAFT_579835 [Bimuria novae-zelandiae CBS 107.79]|uniref:Inner kinetochore subunit AME1 domain-containing protein n=1 Tax=Bimuria novae-zelandiae CBS 107.79 TaxID=1447943 RepID=A0A6A5VCG9_9PLEO|nr:hypothetical protein BU23DRAFT_579835 [Bimuria novae-zelandiae CBS 107.79]
MAPIGMHFWNNDFTTSAITDFNFNFNFAPAATKQSSLPPPHTQRTPIPRQQTPRGRNSSAQRHRSASVHRSSSIRRHATPKTWATPKLGKRKRGSNDAQVDEDDGEPDELSPDLNNQTNSVERPTRVVGTVSPIREEGDDEPDELTMALEEAGSLPQPATDDTADTAISAKTPIPPNTAREKVPSTNGAKAMFMRSRTSARRSKSSEAPPETPTILPHRSSRSSTRSNAPATPSVVLVEEEDELTPAPASVTPRVVGEQSTGQVIPQEEDDVDELSSPAQPANSGTIPTPVVSKTRIPPSLPKTQLTNPTAPAPAKRGRPKRIVVDEEDEVQSTPAPSKARHKKTSLDIQESVDAEDSLDELSPEAKRTQKPPSKQRLVAQPAPHHDDIVEVSSAEEESVQEELGEEDEPTIRVLPAAKEKPVRRAKDPAPRKKRKFSGPKQAISVMRIKGSTVKGVTVADTTRTILEENMDNQVQRMASKLGTTEDSSRRKKLRGHINLALAFKESLVEKLMDLQDANDTLSAGFKKRKLLRKGNIERRKEILTIQNRRHEVALEMDDERAVYDAEKEKAEAKSKLSSNLFEIQAAIQSGRERARRENREDEGPERPLSMLLETVGRQVGSVGGGLLGTIHHFNERLEGAAGWLEGRA